MHLLGVLGLIGDDLDGLRECSGENVDEVDVQLELLSANAREKLRIRRETQQLSETCHRIVVFMNPLQYGDYQASSIRYTRVNPPGDDGSLHRL